MSTAGALKRRGRLTIEVVAIARSFWRDGCAEAGSARLLAFEQTLLDETSPERRALISIAAGDAKGAISAAVDRLILQTESDLELTDLIMSLLWRHASSDDPIALAAYERFRGLVLDSQ